MEKTGNLDSSMQLLSKVLDLRAQKAQAISANIANAETPGYSPARFEFETELARALDNKRGLALAVSNQRHIPLGPANFHEVAGKVVFEKEQELIGDHNGVSVDQEMLDLSENQLLYETAAQLLKKKLSMMRHVVSGGQ